MNMLKKSAILPLAVLFPLLLTACGSNTNSKSGSSSTTKAISTAKRHSPESSSSLSSSFVQDSSSSSVSSSESSALDNRAAAIQAISGKTYSISPVLYDGEPVNDAMDENKAPQNLVHDGAQLIHFVDGSSARFKGLGSYNPTHNIDYTIDNSSISVDNFTIPYTINNGQIAFSQWTTSDNDGHSVTWEVTTSNVPVD